MKNIVICNQKGGVGKSMIADELAFSFERSGIPISFYDLDHQGGTLHKSRECEEAEAAIVDTPGSLHKEMGEWLAQASLLIVPTRPTSRDIAPLQRMFEIINAKAAKTPSIIVLNGWNRFRASRDFMDWLMGEAGGIYQIPQSEIIVQAGAAGKSVVDYAKGSPAAKAALALANGIRRMLGFEPEKARNGD